MDAGPETATHIVPEEASGMRLRDFASSVCPGIPAKGIRKAIRRGQVRLDGQRVDSNRSIQAGQVVTITLPAPDQTVAVPPGMSVEYADAHIAVIYKPEGVACGGKLKHYIEKLLARSACRSEEEDSLYICRPLHRLDVATCGLLVAARTATALRSLSHQFERKSVLKKYIAVLHGQAPSSQRIDAPLDGKEAITHLKHIAHGQLVDGEVVSLVELTPETGRTHQLRKHAASLGMPIYGDMKYGRTTGQTGLLLCAVALAFKHPHTQEKVTFTIGLPQKFMRFPGASAHGAEPWPGA